MCGHDSYEQMLAQVADVCQLYALGGPSTAQCQAAALAEVAHMISRRIDLRPDMPIRALARHRA